MKETKRVSDDVSLCHRLVFWLAVKISLVTDSGRSATLSPPLWAVVQKQER